MTYVEKRTKSRYVRRKLMACRQRLGLTLQQVADLSGISRPHYNHIENAKYTPRIKTMQKIAEVLKVNNYELLYEIQDVYTGEVQEHTSKSIRVL